MLLGVSEQTIYTWRNHELIDTGQWPGVSSTDHAQLIVARKPIAELETELAVTKRANELLKESVSPTGGAADAMMVSEGPPIQTACRVLDVAESTFYAQRSDRRQRGRYAVPG